MTQDEFGLLEEAEMKKLRLDNRVGVFLKV